MTVVSTLDITDLTAPEYRAVMDELGVKQRPEGGIYLHLTTPTDAGPETQAYVARILGLLDGAGALVAPELEVRLVD